VADFIDYRSFFDSLPDELPIVWTLHDLNPFTGGCHYTGGCDNFTHQCGNCPQLARPGPTDLSYHTHAIKREVLHGRNLRLVAPGEWMREQCRRSSLFGQLENIHTIHNGLDTAVFAPRDRAEARRELGLPESKVVVAFGAESLRDRRKGVSELLTSLELLARPEEILAVAFGRGELRHRRRPLPEIRCTGYIDEPTRLAALYSSADLFVIPSLQENCPQTALEAMACGTPVVGFAAGGIPDYVSPYQTGLLARPGDPRDLAAKISWMIDHPEERTQMGREARTLTTREYSLETQAGRISDLYSSLIKEQTGGPGRDASN
jgi:glycosyltransferase involved in cell wall biosynthesis